MANKKYNSFLSNLAKGVFNLDTNTLNIMLVSSAYVASANIDSDTITEANAGEISGTGYTAGGKALVGNAVTQDNANDLAKLDANDVVWAASTITAGGAVIYKDTTNELICIVDFGGDKVSTAGNLTITWDANGIITIS